MAILRAKPATNAEPADLVPVFASSRLRPQNDNRPRLPPEIEFLAGTVLPESTLRGVAQRAALAGTTADIVLLAEGHISSDAFYRRLAVELGLPYGERPLRAADDVTLEDVLRDGVMALAPNRQGWQFLLAPRGATLTALLSYMKTTRASNRPAIAVTSPDRIEALIRFHQRRAIAHTASHGLSAWDQPLSAKSGPNLFQSALLLLAASLFCLGAWLDPFVCANAVELLLSLVFFAAMALRLVATASSPRPVEEPPRLRSPDDEMPMYSIVVPLFREARVVRRLAAALDRIDYPRSKLDIILMVEANDPGTLNALQALNLPACYRIIVAPRGAPQTKPRALNVALQFARGRFLVIYDAEDEPQPDQLRKALARFAVEPQTACLQARLAIDNIEDSWLTRLFAMEYAALFHVVNPGLAALGLPIPLGGTSNHFRIEALRRVNGWDAWNVTEDIDLGIRMARFGLSIGTLDSTTFEEAPNTLKAWLAQRCRWQKGWIVTLMTHSRNPRRAWRDLGTTNALAVCALLIGTISSCLLGPFYAVVLGMRLWSGSLLCPRGALDVAWSILCFIMIAMGVASAVWPTLLGLRRRGLLSLAGWLALTPVYLALLSIAAWRGAFQLLDSPFFWVKTEHGRAKKRLGVSMKA